MSGHLLSSQPSTSLQSTSCFNAVGTLGHLMHTSANSTAHSRTRQASSLVDTKVSSRHLARSNDLISVYFVLDEVLVLLIYVSRYLLDRIWQTGRTATAPANRARTEKTYWAPRQALVSYLPVLCRGIICRYRAAATRCSRISR